MNKIYRYMLYPIIFIFLIMVLIIVKFALIPFYFIACYKYWKAPTIYLKQKYRAKMSCLNPFKS